MRPAWGVPSFCRSSRSLACESTAGPEGLEIPIESGKPQCQDVEKAWWLPAHACSLEPTLDDMLARPLHRAGADGEPGIPGLLVPDPGSVPLHIANQLDQRVADGLLPWPQALERPEDLPHTVHEERPHFLLHPGFGSSRVG